MAEAATAVIAAEGEAVGSTFTLDRLRGGRPGGGGGEEEEEGGEEELS